MSAVPGVSESPAPVTFRAGVYRHYKGATYLALGLAQGEDDPQLVVVYVRLYPQDARGGPPLRLRSYAVWRQYVDPDTGEVGSLLSNKTVPRFSYLGVDA